MKKLLNEEIKYNIIKTRNGKKMASIYGTNKESNDKISKKGDLIKSHGAVFNSSMRRWVWWLSDDEKELKTQLKNFIIPCIEDLTEVDNEGNDVDLDETTQNTINGLIEMLNNVLKLKIDVNDLDDGLTVDVEEIQEKVLSFKNRLIEITSSEEFKELFDPIIKKQQALGPSFSILNTILIWIQDPMATEVKTKTDWKRRNRVIKDGAPVICLYKPYGVDEYDTPEKREECIAKFLSDNDVTSINQLTIGQREELEKELKKVKEVWGFNLLPAWYDIRYTKVKEGKEDPVPSNEGSKNIAWFEKLPATKRTAVLYNAIVKTITNAKIKITYSEDLGGALGVSRGGWIELLNPEISGKTIQAVDTAIHELGHELLHQVYLKNSNPGEFGSFFVGRKNSRSHRERQAELIAWIVCSYFGYELETSTNYMGCWGMSAELAPKVFDAVANVANYIILGMSKNMKSGLKEGVESSGPVTGEYIANLVGLGGLYRQNKKKNINATNESELTTLIKKTINEVLKNK
jgi:hypothetical protein